MNQPDDGVASGACLDLLWSEAAARALLFLRNRGADRFDLDAGFACHDPNGVDDHGPFAGRFEDFRAFVAEREKVTPALAKSHLISNLLVEPSDDLLFCESYHIAREFYPTPTGVTVNEIGGRYLDYLRLDPTPQIVRRAVVYDWSRVTQEPDGVSGGPPALAGRRSRQDPLYIARPQFWARAPQQRPPLIGRGEESVSEDQGLAALRAEAEITRVVYRRARATDRADVDLALSCYHDGATERFENYSGDSRAFVQQRLSAPNPAMAYMFHFISNVLVTLEDADTAFVESYFDLRYQVRGQTAVDHSVGGRYLDTFRRMDGRWAIFHRDTVVDFRRTAPEAAPYWPADADGFLFGRRGPDDPLYQHIERGPTALA